MYRKLQLNNAQMLQHTGISVCIYTTICIEKRSWNEHLNHIISHLILISALKAGTFIFFLIGIIGRIFCVIYKPYKVNAIFW